MVSTPRFKNASNSGYPMTHTHVLTNRSRTLTRVVAACWLATVGLAPAASQAASDANGKALAAEAKEILRANCYDCHKPGLAQSGVRVLDHQSLIDDGWVVPGSPDDSYLFRLITATDGNVMPPENRPRLTQEQKAGIREWIAAGAAAFPADALSPGDWATTDKKPESEPGAQLEPSSKPAADDQASPKDARQEDGDEDDRGEAEDDAEQDKQPEPTTAKQPEKKRVPDDGGVMNVILSHVRSLPGEDRPFYRYFSTRHRLRAGATEERLAEHRIAFTKAINHLSYESDLVLPKTIDKVAGGTVFAIDIRRLGWHRRELKPVDPEPAGDLKDKQALSLYDLVLLEYPYAVHSEDDTVSLAVADEFLRVARQVRPIAYVRADWFCSVVLQPPLYHDLMQLPLTLEELEDDLNVDSEQNLQDLQAKRAGIMVSGVSRNNRVVERHRQASGYYWKSHDFASNTGSQNILVDPLDFQAFGGEMIFSLPNGSQGYYVSDASGRRIDAAPTSIVIDKHASDRVVRNGLGCIRCHATGIKTFHDDVRDVLDVLPANPGFDKAKARRLYPGNDAWGEVVSRDRKRFTAAMAELGCDAYAAKEPLAIITEEYLENTLSPRVAAAELGLVDQYNRRGELLNRAATQLAAVCAAPGFTRLGLASFAAGGVIRRDAWEDNFDAAVRGLGAGVPLVPINGLLRSEYLGDALAKDVTLRTNKKNGLYEVGDELTVFVDNNSREAIEVDLFGIGANGKMVRLGESGVKLDAGETHRFPPEGRAIKIRGGAGKEQIVMYASRSDLPASTIFRGENLADRVVHLAYVLRSDDDTGATPRLESDAADIVKKSLFIETK